MPGVNAYRKLKPFLASRAEAAAKMAESVPRVKAEAPLLNEQSLRSLFAAEFRGDGSNPVVYNRYQSVFGHQQNSAYQYFKTDFSPMSQLVNVRELLDGNNPPSAGLVLPCYTPADAQDRTLVFESRFESGNLALALKVSDSEYNLVLSNDINTKGHTQCKPAPMTSL